MAKPKETMLKQGASGDDFPDVEPAPKPKTKVEKAAEKKAASVKAQKAKPAPEIAFADDLAQTIGNCMERHGKGWMELRELEAALGGLMRAARSPHGWFKARFYGK